MFPKKTGFVPFLGVLGGGIIPHNGLSRQFVKKDNTLFVNILSEYRFVVYIILGVRDAFCGARGWQCARVAVRAGGMVGGAYNIYCEVAQVHETEESAATHGTEGASAQGRANGRRDESRLYNI